MSIDAEENKQIIEEQSDGEVKERETETDESQTDEWVDLLGSGVIKKKIVKEGTAQSPPERHQICLINYELYNNEDELVEKQENFEIDLGDSDVIQGLDVSIGLMNMGETCWLKIEPRLAFGSKGLPPKIPGDSIITYKVELLSVRDEELETMKVSERKQKGNKKRERGNWWYCRGEHSVAVQCYRKALDYLDEVEGGINFPKSDLEEVSDASLQDLLEDRISVYNNLAAAQIKLESYDAALTSLTTVLRCQPNNIKALYRQAKVYKMKNDIKSAMNSLLKAKEVAPNDPDIQTELSRLQKMVEKEKKTERDLAKKMFGTLLAENQKKQSSKKILVWATLAASVAIGVAGLATYRLKLT